MTRNVHIESGDLESGRRAAARMVTIAERLGEPTLLWVATYSGKGCLALLRGDLA